VLVQKDLFSTFTAVSVWMTMSVRSECVDDNECNQSPCGSGTCYNTYGSYRCGCPDGYQFDTALSVCIQVKSFLYMTEKIVTFKLSVLCSQMCCV